MAKRLSSTKTTHHSSSSSASYFSGLGKIDNLQQGAKCFWLRNEFLDLVWWILAFRNLFWSSHWVWGLSVLWQRGVNCWDCTSQSMASGTVHGHSGIRQPIWCLWLWRIGIFACCLLKPIWTRAFISSGHRQTRNTVQPGLLLSPYFSWPSFSVCLVCPEWSLSSL